MAIAVDCANGHRLNIGDQYAGRKVRCPTCQAVIAVPATSSAAVQTTSSAPSTKSSEFRNAEIVPSEIEIDGVIFELAATRAELCDAMAERRPQAYEINLDEYADERSEIAQLYDSTHGESPAMARLLNCAALACRHCGNRMPDDFGSRLAPEADGGRIPKKPIKPECNECQSAEAYLLFEPPAKKKASKPKTGVKPKVRKQLWRVRRGVGLQLVGLVFTFAGFALEVVATIIGEATTANFAAGMLLLVGVIQLTSQVLRIGGAVYCCYAPQKSEGAGCIRACLTLELASLLCVVVAFGLACSWLIWPRGNIDRIFMLLFQFLAAVLGPAAWFTFAVFLKRMGTYLKDRRVVSEMPELIKFATIMYVAPIVAQILLVFVISAIARAMPVPNVAIVTVIRIVLFATFAAWVAGLVKLWLGCMTAYSRVRDSITEWIGEDDEDEDDE